MLCEKATSPKYEKPKIMLLDMSDQCENVLREAGYNVTVGTFGVPYAVPPSDRRALVTLETSALPNYEEQEIILANTVAPTGLRAPNTEHPGEGVLAIWQRAYNGAIDPRPLAMSHVRRAFDRILEHGGIAIVQLSRRYEVEYVQGSASEYRSFHAETHFSGSSWSFLSRLAALESSFDSGSEIEFLQEGQDFGKLLKRGATGAEYTCTVRPESYDREHWIPIARNKFGACVAGVLMKDNPKCCLIVLPQMPDLHSVLSDLIGDWCAQWRPELFPFHQGRAWLFTDRYELPEILRLRQDIVRVKSETQQQVEQLETQIEEVRAQKRDWYTLLNGTGRELVDAMIRTFGSVGFKDVIDVDEQSRSQGEERSLREDIQIRHQSPILVVDVKGITGCPEDAAATQSEKHALMRAKEFQGNVKPLTIINHQRNIPPHERNPQPYREEIVGNAQQTGLGLMTTWDVFRLLRNKEALGWPDDVVRPVFYRTGRVEPIPEHYVEVGRIAHAWKNAVGIIPAQTVQIGSRLAIEVGDLFEEIAVESLQVDKNPVTEAPAGSNCGIACENAGGRFRQGMRVFIVRGPGST